MTNKAKVIAHIPSAFSFQWTGYWRIYRKRSQEELTSGGSPHPSVAISNPYLLEEDAWKEVADTLPDTPPPLRRCRSERVLPLTQQIVDVLDREEDEEIRVAALRAILIIPRFERARSRG